MPEREIARTTEAASPEAQAIDRLRSEIELHEKQEKSRSYLGTAISAIYRKDDNELQSLKDLDAAIKQAQKTGDTRALTELTGQVDDKVRDHRKALVFQEEVNHYGAGFLKTAGIFARGRLGLAGTVAAYALDQMRPADSFKDQLANAALGGAKGGLLKASFEFLGHKKVGIAAQGIGLGVSSRLLEYGLTPETYLNKSTGQHDLGTGLTATIKGTLDRKALVSDVVIFGAAHGLLGRFNALSGGAIDRSPLARTMLTGTTFGLSMGSVEEINRQHAAGESFDLGKVLQRSLLRGAIDTFAAGPGGLQARAAFRAQSGADSRLSVELRSLKSDAALQEGAAEAAGLRPREFVVVEGQEALRNLGARSQNEGWLRVREVLGKKTDGTETLGDIKRLFVQSLGRGDRVNPVAVRQADLLAFCNPEAAEGIARAKHIFSQAEGPVFATPDAVQGRVTFSIGRIPIELASTYRLSDAIHLGRTRSVAEVLESHGHSDYAEIISSHPRFRGLKATRILGEGNETVAVEIAPSEKFPDGAALKITIPEGGWDYSWGKREFDAKMLREPVEVNLESGGTAYIYVQELLSMYPRYAPEQLDAFFAKVQRAKLELADPGTDPNAQIGISKRTGELVLADYAAIDKPGANETHQEIIGGKQRVEEQYDAELERQRRGEPEERVEDHYENVLDIDIEARRQQFLENPSLAEHHRSILQQIFMGESPKEVAYYRAIELGHFNPSSGKVDTTVGKQDVKAAMDLARQAGILPKS